MEKLAKMKCVACREGAPTVTNEEIKEFKPQVPDWDIVEREGIYRLERMFSFNDFLEAVAFTNGIGT